MHTCPFCGYECDCDLDDTGGLPVPDDCSHVCPEDDFEGGFETDQFGSAYDEGDGMNELRECPFCGKGEITIDYYEISGPHELGAMFVCKNCGASCRPENWSTRPLENALRERAETAEKLVAVLEAKFRYILRIDDNDHTFQPPQEDLK